MISKIYDKLKFKEGEEEEKKSVGIYVGATQARVG